MHSRFTHIVTCDYDKIPLCNNLVRDDVQSINHPRSTVESDRKCVLLSMGARSWNLAYYNKQRPHSNRTGNRIATRTTRNRKGACREHTTGCYHAWSTHQRQHELPGDLPTTLTRQPLRSRCASTQQSHQVPHMPGGIIGAIRCIDPV